MKKLSLIVRASLIAPLALALAACDSAEGEEGSLEGEPIAAIAAPEGQQWSNSGMISESQGHVMGNPDAPLKLIEYASHTCGACAGFSQSASEELREYVNSGVVSYEMRNLIRDPLDLTIARLARCSTPEAFHPLSEQAWGSFNEIMGAAQQNAEQIQAAVQAQNFGQIAEAAGLLEYFAQRGISKDQAAACLSDSEGIVALAEELDAVAKADNITATPTFFLNGQMLEERSWEELEATLQRAGARQE